MAEVSAHDAAATHICREPGCPGEARSPRGINAYCDTHRAARQAAIAAGRAPITRGESKPKREPTPLEAMARELVGLAREVDLARTDAERATTHYRDVLVRWRAIVDGFPRDPRQIGGAS